ncbi:MAG: Uma2 family endonuclease [Candidatus Flexifilum sp.]
MTTPDLTHERLYTVEEFAALPGGGPLRELIRGRIIDVPPAGTDHSMLASWIATLLNNSALPGRLGIVTGEQGGYLLSEDTVRAPDAAFMSRERLRKRGPYAVGGPDLVVEVVSPGDSAGELQGKINDFFRAGTRLLWVVYPETRQIVVHTRNAARTLNEADTLDGGDVLPGFRVSVSQIFAVLDPPAPEG